jgi:hypothetical protein
MTIGGARADSQIVLRDAGIKGTYESRIFRAYIQARIAGHDGCSVAPDTWQRSPDTNNVLDEKREIFHHLGISRLTPAGGGADASQTSIRSPF